VAVTTLAAAVAFGEARALAGVMNVDDGRAANQDGRGYWIGADYRIGSHLVRAQYVLNDPRFGTDNESRAIGVGYQYDFTRRTALYGALTRFDNKADAGSGGLGRWHTSIPTGLTSLADNDITELVVGLRHLF
jgi:predicted porin